MTFHQQLEAIKYSRGSLQLLDQRLLPLQQTFLDIETCEDAHARIKEMAVRGAPAIAIAGFLALAVELHNGGAGAQFTDAAHASQAIQEKSEYLVTRCCTRCWLLRCIVLSCAAVGILPCNLFCGCRTQLNCR